MFESLKVVLKKYGCNFDDVSKIGYYSIRKLLNENHIFLEKLSANLKYLFQPLDVQGGPNRNAFYEEKVYALVRTPSDACP